MAKDKGVEAFLRGLEKEFGVKMRRTPSKPAQPAPSRYGPSSGPMTQAQLDRAYKGVGGVDLQSFEGWLKALGYDKKRREEEIEEQYRTNFVHEQVDKQREYQEKREKQLRKEFFENDWFDRNISSHLRKGVSSVGKGISSGVGNSLEAVGLKDNVEDVARIAGKGVSGVISALSRPSHAINNTRKAFLELDKDEPSFSRELTLSNVLKDMAGGVAFTGGKRSYESLDELVTDPIDSVKKLGSGFWKGLSGQEKTTNDEIIKKYAEMQNNPLYKNSWYQNIYGLGLDVVMDPLTYAGVGTVRKGASLAKQGMDSASKTRRVRELKQTKDEIQTALNYNAEAIAKKEMAVKNYEDRVSRNREALMETANNRVQNQLDSAISEGRIPGLEGFDDIVGTLQGEDITRLVREHGEYGRRKNITGTSGSFTRDKNKWLKDNPGADPSEYTFTRWQNEVKDLDTSLGKYFEGDERLSGYTPNQVIKSVNDDLYKNSDEFKRIETQRKNLVSEKKKLEPEVRRIHALDRARTEAERNILRQYKNVNNELKLVRDRKTAMISNGFSEAVRNIRSNSTKYTDPEYAQHLTKLREAVEGKFDAEGNLIRHGEPNLSGDLSTPESSRAIDSTLDDILPEVSDEINPEGLAKLVEGAPSRKRSRIEDVSRVDRYSEVEAPVMREAIDKRRASAHGEQVRRDLGAEKRLFENEAKSSVGKKKPGSVTPTPKVSGADAIKADGVKAVDRTSDLGRRVGNEGEVTYDALSDIIERNPNLSKLVDDIDRELDSLTTPVGRLNTKDVDIPVILKDKDGNLDVSRLTTSSKDVDGKEIPATIRFDKGDSHRLYVSKNSLLRNLGNDTELAEEILPFIQKVVDTANRSAVGINRVADKERAAFDALEKLGTSLSSAKELSTRPLSFNVSGNKETIERKRKNLQRIGRERFKLEYKERQRALEQLRKSGDMQKMVAAKRELSALKKSEAEYRSMINEVMDEMRKIDTFSVKREREASRISQILAGTHNGESVGLTLRILNKELTSGRSTSVLIAAGKHLNDNSVINSFTGVYRKAFQSMESALPIDMHRMRAHAMNRPAQLIRHYSDELSEGIGQMSKSERIQEYSITGSSALNSEVNKVFNDMLPYFNKGQVIGDSIVSVDDINKFLPESMVFAGEKRLSNYTLDDLKDAIGTSLEKRKKRIREHKNANPDYVYTDDEKRLLELRTPSDPLELAWNLRIAVEQATAYRGLTDSLTKLWGVERIVPTRTSRSGHTYYTSEYKRSKETADYVEGLQKDGWKSIPELGNTHYFPPEVAPDIEKLLTIFDVRNSTRVGRLIDDVTGAWKVGATIYNPGYYTRNLVGEVMAGWLGGVNEPKYYNNSMKWSKAIRGIDKEQYGPLLENEAFASYLKRNTPDTTVSVTKRNGKDVSALQAEALWLDNGLESSFLNTDYQEVAKRGKSELRANPITKGAMRVHDKVRRFGENAENFPRKAHFLHALEHAPQHLSLEKAGEWAAAQVRKYHFDYSDVTDFEKIVMMRAFPFYKWTRKAAPLMLQMMFIQPGKTTFPAKVHSAISRATNPDEKTTDGYNPYYPEGTPDWIKDSGAYKMGTDAEGKDTYGYMATTQSDALKALTDPLGAANTLLNPFFKTPTELALGSSLNTDVDNAQFTSGGDRLKSMVNSLPQAKFLERSFSLKENPYTEPGGPVAGVIPRMDERLLSFMTGVGAYEDPGFDNPMTNLKNRLKYFDAEGEFNVGRYYKDFPEKKTEGYKNWEEVQEKNRIREKFLDSSGYPTRGYYDLYPEDMSEGTRKYFFIEDLRAKYGVGKNQRWPRAMQLEYYQEYPGDRKY